MTYTFRAVFENIFWPAAAGNVFWSLCSIALTRGSWGVPVWSSLVILSFFSLYLTLGWLRLKVSTDDIPVLYWPFEFTHLLLFVAASIAAQSRVDLLYYFLVVYFSIMTVGHYFRVWKLDDEHGYPRNALVIIHIIGLTVLVLGRWRGVDDYTMPGSFIVVFVLWLMLGRFSLGTVERRLRAQCFSAGKIPDDAALIGQRSR